MIAVNLFKSHNDLDSVWIGILGSSSSSGHLPIQGQAVIKNNPSLRLPAAYRRLLGFKKTNAKDEQILKDAELFSRTIINHPFMSALLV